MIITEAGVRERVSHLMYVTSVMPFTQSPRRIAWRHKRTSYFVCTEDLATPAEVQRRRVREGTRIVELEAGHHPFLSRPVAFADSLAAEINRA